MPWLRSRNRTTLAAVAVHEKDTAAKYRFTASAAIRHRSRLNAAIAIALLTVDDAMREDAASTIALQSMVCIEAIIGL